MRVLTANFRNGLETTRVANQLLKIKQRRFGSIDRESNFLVQAVGGEAGQVALMPDKDTAKRELDRKIRQSTQFAVLVMRDEDKAEARRHFATPLLFSIHEAKGLEYENIVLYRFISDHRAEFSEIVEGVVSADLLVETLDYRRARDKSDKSLAVSYTHLDVYKRQSLGLAAQYLPVEFHSLLRRAALLLPAGIPGGPAVRLPGRRPGARRRPGSADPGRPVVAIALRLLHGLSR